MKKALLHTLASATLTACAQDDVTTQKDITHNIEKILDVDALSLKQLELQKKVIHNGIVYVISIDKHEHTMDLRINYQGKSRNIALEDKGSDGLLDKASITYDEKDEFHPRMTEILDPHYADLDGFLNRSSKHIHVESTDLDSLLHPERKTFFTSLQAQLLREVYDVLLAEKCYTDQKGKKQ